MHLNDYQAKAAETSGDISIGGSTLLYPVLGLCNEAGEVAGKVKKLFRDDAGELTPERKEAIVLELGDVLWYLAETARQLGVSLEDVAEKNIAKLASRKERGAIGGSGDTR